MCSTRRASRSAGASSTPTELDDNYRFEQIHAHYRTACGLQEDGTALCFTASNPPTTLPEELSMVKAPGYGLTPDGTLYAPSLVEGLPTGPGHIDIDIHSGWGCAVTSAGALACAGSRERWYTPTPASMRSS